MRPHVLCPTGEARITPGDGLPARHVIHTVGPVWHDGHAGEAARLASCYRRSLWLAQTHGIGSIAFSAISCGVFGYPPAQAARIAVVSVRDWLAQQVLPQRVPLCCFDARMESHYRSSVGTRA